MKKLSFVFLLVLAVFSSCKKEIDDVEEKLFSFDISNEKSFTIPKVQVDTAYAWQQRFGINMPLPVSGVASTTEAELQKNNTTTSLVKNIKLRELVLTVPDNSAEDFSFLEKMDVYIAMEDGSEPILMAYNRDIKTTVGKKLVFQPTESSMDKYVKAGKYSLQLKDTRLRRTVNANMDVMAKLIYSVTASPLN
jgi:hypothetical protein